MKCWNCKIGASWLSDLPEGSSKPLRNAVEKAFRELTGHDAEFTFCGWGGELDELELEVIELMDIS